MYIATVHSFFSVGPYIHVAWLWRLGCLRAPHVHQPQPGQDGVGRPSHDLFLHLLSRMQSFQVAHTTVLACCCTHMIIHTHVLHTCIVCLYIDLPY